MPVPGKIFICAFLLCLLRPSYAQEKCFQINRVNVQGVSRNMLGEIRAITSTYEGQCIGMSQIKDLLRGITNYYVGLGYITTRAFLPEQDLSGGVLQINVQEGYIEDIEVNSKSKFFPANLPLAKHRILSLRDIEQTTDHYGRLKSNDVKISLKPGKSPGGTIVAIDNAATRKWGITSGIDNAGSKQKGQLQSFSNFRAESVLGLNELYSFGYRTSLDDPSILYTKSYNGVFSIPFGYNDFTVSYNHAKYRNYIQGSGNSYSNKGGSKVYKLDFNRVIHRNSEGKTIISAGIGGDDYENYLADNKIEVSTYKVRKYDIGINHQRRFGQGVVACGITFTHGINKGYISSFSQLKSPAKYFNRINFNGSLLKNLPIRFARQSLQYHLQIDGQYSPDLLVTSEKSTLGGLGSIRGFKDYSENTDNVIVVRNELTGFIASGKSRQLQRFFGDISIFTAFDIGYFKNHEEIGTRDGIMSGVAAGIKNRDGIINFSVTLARPIEMPVNYRHKNILYFSVAIDV